MLIFLYAIVFLLVGVYYVRTQRQMTKMSSLVAKMALELADMKEQIQAEGFVDTRDYERAIQQGVENLMSYGVEVAMKGEK